MHTTTQTEHETADQYLRRLFDACTRAGLVAEIIEPSTKLRISTPNGNVRMAEVISLRPDAEEVLTWHWSWGAPMCRADDTDFAVRALTRVVAETRA